MHNLPSDSLPSGDQWTGADIPDGNWMPSEDDNDRDYESDPFENFPHLRPGGGVNCYPGSPGTCHDECYIFTNMVANALECAIHQIFNCPDTKSIIFVGTRAANRRAKVEQSPFGKWVVPDLLRIKRVCRGKGDLWIGVKDTDKPYVEWKN